MGEPELRTTPAGTAVLRIKVASDGPGDLALAVVMTGEKAQSIGPALKTGAEVRVKGSLKALRRRLKSGLAEIGSEVTAESIELETPGGPRN